MTLVGWTIGRTEFDLCSARPRRRGRPADRGTPTTIAPAANVLDRQFTASAPNQKRVADFTYLWTAEGWLFVAVVLDLFSRRIVG